ncbi:MAG TPA: AzlD domain-containing protein [Candidimonas sp.]|nr:AzlD domain-containing protein [Candidimonas sp.]
MQTTLNGTVLVWVIAACGLVTLLIRYLPMRWREKGNGRAAGGGRWRYALDAVGPSAIMALLVTSFWSMAAADPVATTVVPIFVGVSGVILGKRLVGSIAGATLSGVLAYGLALWAVTAIGF